MASGPCPSDMQITCVSSLGAVLSGSDMVNCENRMYFTCGQCVETSDKSSELLVRHESASTCSETRWGSICRTSLVMGWSSNQACVKPREGTPLVRSLRAHSQVKRRHRGSSGSNGKFARRGDVPGSYMEDVALWNVRWFLSPTVQRVRS